MRKYQHRIGAVVYRFVPDHAESQDITQDAFIRAYRALANFRGDSQFYTWLYRIAVNTAKNHLVAMKRRPPTADIAAEDAEHHAGAGRLHDHDTPEHQLMRQEVEQTVTDTVAGLPEELRQAITLREVDGLSYEEIATVDELPDRHRAFADLPRPRRHRPETAPADGQRTSPPMTQIDPKLLEQLCAWMDGELPPTRPVSCSAASTATPRCARSGSAGNWPRPACVASRCA